MEEGFHLARELLSLYGTLEDSAASLRRAIDELAGREKVFIAAEENLKQAENRVLLADLEQLIPADRVCSGGNERQRTAQLQEATRRERDILELAEKDRVTARAQYETTCLNFRMLQCQMHVLRMMVDLDTDVVLEKKDA